MAGKSAERSGVIISRDVKSGAFLTVKAPGLGSIKVLGRQTFDSAAKKASRTLNTEKSGDSQSGRKR